MKEQKVSTYKIATAYIGTVVGAGFASGQELLQFFVVFGYKGLMGLLIVTALFMYFGYKIMACGRLLNAQSHEIIIQYTCGKIFGTFLDFIIIFFLFGSLTAMVAGSGALMSQLFHIPHLWGNLFMTLLTMVTVITGIKGVINSISFVVPFLLISTIGISIASFYNLPSAIPSTVVQTHVVGPLMQNWWWSALLYTSYNIILSVAILGPLGAHAKDLRSIKRGAILGGLGLGIGALAIFLAIFRNASHLLTVEIPMIYIASQLSLSIQFLYSIVLLAEIYTTAAGSLYGFVARMTQENNTHKSRFVILIALLAVLASQLGFSRLVKYLYPLIGYSGLIFLICLPFAKTKLLIHKKMNSKGPKSQIL